jgi:hypothetical protein
MKKASAFATVLLIGAFVAVTRTHLGRYCVTFDAAGYAHCDQAQHDALTTMIVTVLFAAVAASVAPSRRRRR